MKKTIKLTIIISALFFSSIAYSMPKDHAKQNKAKQTETEQSSASVWIYYLIDLLREGPIAYA